MIQYKINNLDFWKVLKWIEIFSSLIWWKYILFLHFSGFCVGHNIFSFEGVLTSGLDVFQTE